MASFINVFCLAKICSSLAQPVVDIWESFATLDDPGVNFVGSCLEYYDIPHSCKHIQVLKESFYLEEDGSTRFNFLLIISPTEGFISELYLNVTFSHPIDETYVKVCLEQCNLVITFFVVQCFIG